MTSRQPRIPFFVEKRLFRLFVGMVALLHALIVSNIGFAQTGAQVYPGTSTGSSSYGSVSGVGTTGLDFNGSYAPGTTLVAQNTPAAPASLYPGAPVPVTQTPIGSGTYAPAPLYPTTPSTSTPIFTQPQPIDPYAVAPSKSVFPWTGATSPGTVVGSAPSPTGAAPSANSGKMDQFFPETYQAMRRFREATSINATYIPAGSNSSGKSLGMVELDLRMQFGIPCKFIPNNGPGSNGPGFFYIAPGGSLDFWSNQSWAMNNCFSASLDFGMTPQFNEKMALDAWFRLGVFSDFNKITSKSLRYQGRLAGIYTLSNQFKIVAGVIYIDRERYKLLPTGGVIWTPRDDIVLRLTFPNPKASMRLWNSGKAEWWGYIQGDYGGGCWTMDGDRTDYNDIRVGVGLEFETLSKVGGYFEVGGAFGRELYSKSNDYDGSPFPGSYKLNDMVYLKMGFVF